MCHEFPPTQAGMKRLDAILLALATKARNADHRIYRTPHLFEAGGDLRAHLGMLLPHALDGKKAVRSRKGARKLFGGDNVHDNQCFASGHRSGFLKNGGAPNKLL